MTEERAKLKIACPGCLQKLDVTDLDAFAQVKCPRCGGDVIAPKPFGALLLEEPLGQRCGVASYRALDLTLDREVLVRIFEHDPGGLGEGFQALARRAAGVNHPGVVPIYSCGSEQGLPYLVSQFLAGGPVAGRLADWTVSEESTRRAAEWLRQVAAGLQAAAAQAVVHGAVSPQSIFLDADGNAKLGDFGLDLLLAGGEPPWRACGNEVAPYLSPEVLAGAPATTASDVFGLGAVLYRLLTGQGPCGHGADGESARRFWAEGQTPRAVRDCQPSVPQSLSDLCSRMLAAEPSHRPADLVDLGQSLASGSKARTVASQPELARRARASVVSPRPTPPPPRPAQENRRPGRSRGTWVDLLIGIGLAVLLVLAVGVYVRTHGWPGWLHQPPAALPSPGERDVEGMAAPQAPPEAPAPGDPVPVPTAPEDSKAAGVLPPGGEGTATVAGGTPATAARPRPAGLDFLGAKVALARYLKGLPPEVVAGERERIQLIEDTRSYLVRLMKYVAFQDGKETGIRLRSGATVRGVLVYCNERQLSLRSPGTSGLRTIDWNDLAFEQIVDFLEFYIQLRTDQGSVAGGAQNTSLRQEVAEDCLRTAVLCEWYGHPDRARRYARRTVDADPGAAARVSRLVPGFVP